MSLANPLWGAPRIHGELLKLGIELSQATVAKYMDRPRKRPSPKWRTFLEGHLKQLVSTDFFVVPTVSFRVLFVFLLLADHRRRVIHFNVTAHPTSDWTAQQIAEAFPWDTVPRYLLHDRDSIYGDVFRQRVRAMVIREVLAAPRSPWQNGVAERWVESCRRDLLDQIIAVNERHLKRLLSEYIRYYHEDRTHLGLGKGTPNGRSRSIASGSILSQERLGGLHHRYDRAA
jgi:transposase InsO family protein